MSEFEIIEHRLSNIEALMLSQKTVLTLDEVGAYTKLSKSYLYKLTSSGSIPFYKPNGKQIYFEKVEIDKWLLRNKSKTMEEIQGEASTHVALNKR